MTLVDLTLAIPESEPEKDAPAAPCREQRTIATREWRIGQSAQSYCARVHYFTHWGMAGTYIDFPGHIVETDDGADAATVPLERLFRLNATVIRLDREDGSGKISADELAAASPAVPPGDALVLNALGDRRFDQIAERSVYLGRDAVAWVVARGVTLLVSDVYESDTDPQGVFLDLFRHGVYTVCYPVNLHRLTQPMVTLTVLPLRFEKATQLPCRVVAELDDSGGAPGRTRPPVTEHTGITHLRAPEACAHTRRRS